MSNLHAVLVGIEAYGPGISPLSGPASQVASYVAWLQQRDLGDLEDAHVFLSAPEGDDADTATEVAAAGVPEANIRSATVEQIRHHISDVLPRVAAPELLWFWSGHGYVYQPDGSRLVYSADASTSDPRCFDARGLLYYLRSSYFVGLGKQLVLFDTCALDTTKPHNPESLPSPPSVKRRSHMQSAIFASRHAAVVTGELAESALARLEDTTNSGWPPPVELLFDPADLASRHHVFVGDDSEIQLAVPEAATQLGDDLAKARIVAIVGGHARGPLPDHGDLALALADTDPLFPFDHARNLPLVAEYVDRRGADGDAAQGVAEKLAELDGRAVLRSSDSHLLNRLARLPIDVYVTTAYDSLLEDALVLAGRAPQTASFSPDFEPGPLSASPEHPLVYHLYGVLESLDPEAARRCAVSELDVHRFNRAISNDGQGHRLPSVVRRALGYRHLYAGFDLEDRMMTWLLHALRDARVAPGNIGYALEPRYGDLTHAENVAEGVRNFIEAHLREVGPCKAVHVIWDAPAGLFLNKAGEP